MHPVANVRRLSIARALRLALLGLTVTLALLAAVGLAELYHSRQRYEDRIVQAYALEASAGRMLAAGVVEDATLRLAGGPSGATARRRARTVFDNSAALATRQASDDARSLRLVTRAIGVQRAVRGGDGRAGRLDARPNLAALADRQRVRRAEARRAASRQSRRALAVVIGFGMLTVLLTLALVGAILAAGRRPVTQLVEASGRLAAGDLDVRVDEDGPADLAPLARAFNAMAAELAGAQRALADERERLAVTIESLGDALVVVDGEGLIVATNPRADELLPGAAIGSPIAELPGIPDPVDALAGEVVVAHGSRALAVTASRLSFGGRGTVWTVRDVSERARLERLKSEFVATASHELRSPLTSIKGFVELLNASAGLQPAQREWVEIVRVSTDRLVDLVNDLLDVASVEAGRIEFDRQPTDVAESIREVGLLLGPRLAEHRQTLELELAGDLPQAMADPGRVRQVLINLLTNAHQYTDDGGRLTVRATATEGRVVVEVSDTGRGMSPGELEHVFERFYRGASDSTDPGTGLGLAIVRSLVELQGGTIEVASQAGKGTTFTIRLLRATTLGVDAGKPMRQSRTAAQPGD